MYLKQIKTIGFKSFADKTDIEFCPNINGIVGPNGSGKSNVVDAVRFVLGEQSVKSLRGDSNMVDVIFAGSKSRHPLNSASVTLVFDNSDHYLPMEFSELSIKRTIYKTGETEYFINNTKCRLKDITDLLMDSGASKESFNIISQGKISEIISSKPTDRRIIFEETAGVLKYKKRKEEALRKLERTNDNLNRVNDIINELNNQLEPLKVQAENAKIYLSNKEKLNDLEISLIISEIETLNFEYQESKSRIEVINDEIININTSNSSNNVFVLENKEKLKQLEEKIINGQNELVEITEKIEKVNTEIKLLKEREKYQISKDNLKEKVLTLKDEQIKYSNEVHSLNSEIEIKNKELETLDSNISNNNSLLSDIRNKINNISNTINQTNRDINDHNYKIESLKTRINNNSSLPSSVSHILNNPKFKGIHNVIGKIIDNDSKYTDAINTALGAASSNLVVDNEKVAASCVEYLKINKLGRATFYPLNIITGRYIPENIISDLKLQNGFIDIASNLVDYDDIYNNIILNLLGTVIVTDTIDNANTISKKVNQKFKIVTLDGQVINIGGSITGGESIKINSVLKDKYELDKINNDLEILNKKLIENNTNLHVYEKELKTLEDKQYTLTTKKALIQETINSKNNILNETNTKLTDIHNELGGLKNIINNVVSEEENKLLNSYENLINEKETIKKNIELIKIEKNNLSETIENYELETNKFNSYLSKKQKEMQNLEIRVNRIDVQLDNLLLTLTNTYNMTYENALGKYKLEIDIDDAKEKVNEYKNIINSIGNINVGAIEEYDRVSDRFNFLSKQKDDLTAAEHSLLEIISEMDEIMKTKFVETFERVRIEFKNVFTSMFRGGSADLYLTDKDNLLETGIEIIAEPPGKTLKNISLLSGGEMTFTAISLLFAILNIKQLPFCILDEVEAALDEVNVDSFGKYLSIYRNKTQFIIITHKKKTMEYVDVLYGITMQESGVSKLVSVKLENISKEINNEKSS